MGINENSNQIRHITPNQKNFNKEMRNISIHIYILVVLISCKLQLLIKLQSLSFHQFYHVFKKYFNNTRRDQSESPPNFFIKS